MSGSRRDALRGDSAGTIDDGRARHDNRYSVRLMHRRFDGKVALVTGGSRGIGRAADATLAASGAQVASTC